MNLNLKPNEKFFGIIIKIFGFARKMDKAFDLLDLMKAFEIKPNLIFITNLLHISFYNGSIKRGLNVYKILLKNKIKPDNLFFSKLIGNLFKFKKHKLVPEYIKECLKHNCGVKSQIIDSIRLKF